MRGKLSLGTVVLPALFLGCGPHDCFKRGSLPFELGDEVQLSIEGRESPQSETGGVDLPSAGGAPVEDATESLGCGLARDDLRGVTLVVEKSSNGEDQFAHRETCRLMDLIVRGENLEPLAESPKSLAQLKARLKMHERALGGVYFQRFGNDVRFAVALLKLNDWQSPEEGEVDYALLFETDGIGDATCAQAFGIRLE